MPRLCLLLALISPAFTLASPHCPEWPTDKARQELTALDTQLTAWNQAYHLEGHSPVADELYDQALAERDRLGRCFPSVAGAWESRWSSLTPPLRAGLASWASMKAESTRGILRFPGLRVAKKTPWMRLLGSRRKSVGAISCRARRRFWSHSSSAMSWSLRSGSR